MRAAVAVTAICLSAVCFADLRQAKATVAEQENDSTPRGESNATQVEEVVVTAQKREARLQDVPISISV